MTNPTGAGDHAFSVPAVPRIGTPVTIRAMRPGERDRLVAAIAKFDAQSIYARLFSFRRVEEGIDGRGDRAAAAVPEVCLPMCAFRCGVSFRCLCSRSTGTFYGDSFVKAFMVVRVARSVQSATRAEQSILRTRGRGTSSARASARTSFYPCRTQASDTPCKIRAECAGQPLLPARPPPQRLPRRHGSGPSDWP